MVSERIKDLRERDGYSQTALSKKLGLTRSSINAWETGISVPSTQYLVELSRLFKVSTDYILGMDTSESLLIGNLTIEQKNILSALVEQFARDITSLLKPWTWTLLLTQKRH
ncbi:helix-turn-helix transcriptional regulator [Emergencia timonensis]|uniref:helix-turn-helix transcriptional regulator n=1 Tax=Emergencia timonensis TaxID=1776384 RepID=UPI0024A864DB|nr:helix-turn-helix transcriptional regulator [Emergencia timonensis]